MDKYCSSMVHLLRGRELGFRNALTGNVTIRCTKHKMLQMCGNMHDCTENFDDRACSYLATCHDILRGFRDRNCNGEKIHHNENYDEEEEEIRNDIVIDMDIDTFEVTMKFLWHTYKFNVVKEYDDIYIEVRSCLDGDLKMTLDAKKIIINVLNLPLEEWEVLKKEKLGELIRRAYSGITYEVGILTDSAALELKNQTTEDMWEGECRLKSGVWNHYYISYSRVFKPLILPRAAFKAERENELLRPDSTR